MNGIFGPLIQNINRTNQENAAQMTKIAYFFGAPDAPARRRQNPVVIRNEEPTIEQIRPQVVEERNIGARLRQQEVQEDQNEQPRPIMVVNMDQNVDEIVHKI